MTQNYSCMHKTTAGEKRKALQREAKATMKAASVLPEAGCKSRELKEEADRLRADAEALKDQARLEDLTVWALDKVKSTKKAAGLITTGWLPGGKAARPGTYTWEAVRKWTPRQPCRRPGRLKAEALGIKL